MYLDTVRRAYEAVNLAGHINDTVLHPDAYESHFFEPMPRPRAEGPRAFPFRVADAFGDATRNAVYLAQATGGIVRFVRSIPQFQATMELSVLARSGSPALIMLYHPVANMVIGRGHRPELVWAPETHSNGQRAAFNVYNEHSRYGLAGYVLEAAPVKCADWLEGCGQHGVAAACMLAAVAGRCLLQLPRLAICAEVLAVELIVVAPVVGVMFVCEMTLRTVVGALNLLPGQHFRSHGAADVFFNQARAWGPIPYEDTDVDDGSPGVDQRLRDRLSKLNQRLRPLYQSATSTPAQINEAIDSMASDLRRYCRQLPSPQPLRGALALLKATIESLWTADEGVVFEPPELAMA